MASTSGRRILTCGDIDGDLERVYSDVVKQEAVHGKFDMLFAVGKFLPANQTKGTGLQAYVSGEKTAPIKTFFIDSESGIFCSSAAKGRMLGRTNIEYLGAYGVREIGGLKIGFLSGRQAPEDRYDEEHMFDDGLPKHTPEGYYTKAIVEYMKSQDGPIDVLLTSEWPHGMNGNCSKNTFDPDPDLNVTSTGVAEIAAILEPRFHIFSLANRFYRRQPYQSRSGHICRPIGLGKIGEKGVDHKALHALIIVPFKGCKREGLMRGIEDATPCPYEVKRVEKPIPTDRKRVLEESDAHIAKYIKSEASPGHILRQVNDKWVLDISFGEGRSFSIETGEVARRAGGSVMVCDGDTRVLCTACANTEPLDEIDGRGPPLSVDYKERYSAIGATAGGFVKRDPIFCTDHEVLVCRLTDRPLRPLLPETWNYDTQVMMYVMSYDEVNPPEPLAVTGALASILLSDIPIKEPIAGISISLMVDGRYVINPSVLERKNAKLSLMCSGTSEAILTIEASANFATEKEILSGVDVAHEAIKVICAGLKALQLKAGKEKRDTQSIEVPRELSAIIDRLYGKRVDKLLKELEKVPAAEHEALIQDLEREAISELGPAEEGQHKVFKFFSKDVHIVFQRLCCTRMLTLLKTSGRRIDGRAAEQVRKLEIVSHYLPTPHGSVLFTQGGLQTIGTCTLGDSSSQQRVESIVNTHRKRFYVQHFTPPLSTGEARKTEKPDFSKQRFEICDADCAERALTPSIPDSHDFSYTIRTESFMTESKGSTAVAAVCGCTLAMIDAGVPLAQNVAAVSVGLLDIDDGIATSEGILVSDLSDVELGVGKMDMKISGSLDGISSLQLDVRNKGVSVSLFEDALKQGRKARIQVLEDIRKHVDELEHRNLPDNVPKILKFKIPPEIKGKVIGPGGANLRKLISEFNLKNIILDDDNNVEVTSMDDAINNTVKMIIDDVAHAAQECGGGGGSAYGKAFTADLPRCSVDIPISAKGKIIGRGGANVRALVEEFSLIDVKVHEDGRVDIIGGTEENRYAAKEKVSRLASGTGGEAHGLNPDLIVEIQKSNVGKLIGKRGVNVRKMVEDFGMQDIRVRHSTTENVGIVELYGGTEDNRERLADHIQAVDLGTASADADPAMPDNSSFNDHDGEGMMGVELSKDEQHVDEDWSNVNFDGTPMDVEQENYEEPLNGASLGDYDVPISDMGGGDGYPGETSIRPTVSSLGGPSRFAASRGERQTNGHRDGESPNRGWVDSANSVGQSTFLQGLEKRGGIGGSRQLSGVLPPLNSALKKTTSSQAALDARHIAEGVAAQLNRVGNSNSNSSSGIAPTPPFMQDKTSSRNASFSAIHTQPYKVQVQMELAELCPGDEKTFADLDTIKRRVVRDQAAVFQLSVEEYPNGDVVVTRPAGEDAY